MTTRVIAALLFARLLLAGPAASAALEARVDRTSLGADETFGLLLRLRDGGAAPDLSPLGADFEILDVQQGSRTSIVNGRKDQSRDWWVELAPKRAGDVRIPALRAGRETSQPIDLRVTARGSGPDDRGSSHPEVFVELEADDTTPYVQGQVVLTARIHSTSAIREGALSDPEVPGALVERVGDDVRHRREIGGRSYEVIERQYAVFPQESGELHVSPVVFEGRLAEERTARRSRRDPFAGFFDDSLFDGFGGLGAFGGLDAFFGGGGQRVRTLSQALTLDVQSKPEAAGDRWWIPAENVELVEQWPSEPPLLRVGEPAERTIAIRATGLSGSQLPELELPQVDGAKQYREPAVDDTFRVDDRVVAVKLQKTAVIATKPGPLTLPEVQLAWWDTTADAPRTARLPARTVEVLPGDPAQAVAPLAETDGDGDAHGDTDTAATGSAAASEPGPEPGVRPWLLGAVLAAAALAAGLPALLLVRSRRARVPGTTDSGTAGSSPRPSRSAAERELRRACESCEPEAATAALRDLARVRFGEARALSAESFGERLASPALTAAIRTLDRVRYARDGEAWEGRELWNAYREARRRSPQRRESAPPPLPALYPAR